MNSKGISLFSEFAYRVKAYLLHPAVDMIVNMKFSKRLQEMEQTSENENLSHEGRMIAHLVAQNQSKEIQHSEKGDLKEPLVNMTRQQQYNSGTTTWKKTPSNNAPDKQNKIESESLRHHTHGLFEDRHSFAGTNAISLENIISTATPARKREG